MAIHNRIPSTFVHPYGNENAAASFYKWMQDLFDHPDGYPIIFDGEFNGDTRREMLYPCLMVQQVDTADPGTTFFGADSNRSLLMFYIWCYHNRAEAFGGTSRLLRRMRDQVVFALRNAGNYKESAGDVVIPPIQLYTFQTATPTALGNTILSPDSNLMQHYTEDGEILRYEILVRLTYSELF